MQFGYVESVSNLAWIGLNWRCIAYRIPLVFVVYVLNACLCVRVYTMRYVLLQHRPYELISSRQFTILNVSVKLENM